MRRIFMLNSLLFSKELLVASLKLKKYKVLLIWHGKAIEKAIFYLAGFHLFPRSFVHFPDVEFQGRLRLEHRRAHYTLKSLC